MNTTLSSKHAYCPLSMIVSNLFNRGFAAKAPAQVLVTVQAWGNDYHAVIEEDQVVNANN